MHRAALQRWSRRRDVRAPIFGDRYVVHRLDYMDPFIAFGLRVDCAGAGLLGYSRWRVSCCGNGAISLRQQFHGRRGRSAQTRSGPRRPSFAIDARVRTRASSSREKAGALAASLRLLTTYDRCTMFSRLLLIAGLMGVWSCSDDEKPGANAGGAGASSAGSAGRSHGGAGASAGAGQAGSSAAGHSGSSAGGAMAGGGAGEATSGGGNLGGGGAGSHAGASGAGLGGAGADAGRGGESSDENPYRDCADENSCPVSGSTCHADYGCEPPCPTGTGSCPAPLGGGTATRYCQQKLCRLDCGFGKTCPTGMTCDTPTGFCTPNGQ